VTYTCPKLILSGLYTLRRRRRRRRSSCSLQPSGETRSTTK